MQQLITFDEETEKKVESIKNRHNSEIKLLESRWKQKRLRPYNKLSPSLRDLTNIEQNAATAGDFTTARSIHGDIMNKKKEELQEAQYRADNEYNQILSSLIQRQENELSNFLDTRSHKRELLIRKQQNELDTTEDKANISKFRMDNNKPFKSNDPNLPIRGLVRPFIQTNQSNASSLSPKLLPSIRPPPLKNGNWPHKQSSTSKKVTKCVPKIRHKINFDNNEFDVMNAMDVLKKRFSKMTQEKEKTTNFKKNQKKNNKDEDLLDFSAYYENKRNPAHLKFHKRKKKNDDIKDSIKNQPYFEPVKRKMNVQSIMRKVKEREENKRKPPVINSKRKPLKPPKRTKKFGEEEEEYYDDDNENDMNSEFKQKMDATSSINEVYDRIVGDVSKKKVKFSSKKGISEKENKESKIKLDNGDLKQIEIIKKRRSKQTEKTIHKDRNQSDLKLYFCPQDKTNHDYYSSVEYESDFSKTNKLNTDGEDSLTQVQTDKRYNEKITKSTLEDSVDYFYSSSSSYYYSGYSFDGKERGEREKIYQDKNGNEIIIVKGDNFIDKPHHKTYDKEEYTKIIKINYDYSNIKYKSGYEEEEEEEEEEEGEEIVDNLINQSNTRKNEDANSKRVKNIDSKNENNTCKKRDEYSSFFPDFEEEEEENLENKNENPSKELDKKDKKLIKNISNLLKSSNSDLNDQQSNKNSKQEKNNNHSDSLQPSEKHSKNIDDKKSDIDSNFSDHDKNLSKRKSNSDSQRDDHHKKTKEPNFENSNILPGSKQTHKSNDNKIHKKSEKSKDLNSNSDTNHGIQDNSSDNHNNDDKNSQNKVSRKNSSQNHTSRHHHHKKHKLDGGSNNSIYKDDGKLKSDNKIDNNEIDNKISNLDNKNLTYSQMTSINIIIDKKNSDDIQNQQNQNFPYISKLAISSIIPHETIKKNNKFKFPKPPSIPTNHNKNPVLKHSCDEEKDHLSLSDKDRPPRSKYTNKNIAKRASSSRMSSRLVQQANNSINNSSLFGSAVETKSSIIVKVKH